MVRYDTDRSPFWIFEPISEREGTIHDLVVRKWWDIKGNPTRPNGEEYYYFAWMEQANGHSKLSNCWQMAHGLLRSLLNDRTLFLDQIIFYLLLFL